MILVGDGFTQGVLAAVGKRELLRCSIEALFPRGDHPGLGAEFIERYHRLRAAWAQHSSSDRGVPEFFTILGQQEPLNPEVDRGLFGYVHDSIGHELRSYLWDVFKKVELGVTRDDLQSIRKTPSIKLLEWLLHRCDMSAISFNYECVFERVVAGCIHRRVVSPVEDALRWCETPPDDSMIALKAHGSLYHSPFHDVMGFSNSRIRMDARSNRMVGFGTHILKSLDLMPAFLDVVPPGHARNHRINPGSTVFEAARQLLSRADLVLIWGLSGREPDTPEISGMLSAIRGDAIVVHLGMASRLDCNSPIARIARMYCLRRGYCFVNMGLPTSRLLISELKNVVQLTNTLFSKANVSQARRRYLRSFAFRRRWIRPRSIKFYRYARRI